MLGEPGQALPPTAVEVWPSVAPFGEADRISVSIIALAFLCSSAGSTFASPGGNNHTWPPTAQTTGLDQSQTRDRRPFVGAGHTLRPHFARSSSAGRRWSAARHTSWLTLITSSGRHIMRRTKPLCAPVGGVAIMLRGRLGCGPAVPGGRCAVSARHRLERWVPGQDMTRGPRSASRGSRLRGARVWPVPQRLLGSSVTVSPSLPGRQVPWTKVSAARDVGRDRLCQCCGSALGTSRRRGKPAAGYCPGAAYRGSCRTPRSALPCGARRTHLPRLRTPHVRRDPHAPARRRGTQAPRT